MGEEIPRRGRKGAVAWVGYEAPPTERPALSVRRVVEAAVGVADEHGLDALSIRQLAKELGVTPMAIYGHVANKEQLLDLMLDFVLGEVDVDHRELAPLDAARATIVSYNQVLERHRGMARIYAGAVRIGPNGLRVVDAILGHLMAAGFSAEQAAHAFRALYTYVMGHSQAGRVLPHDAAGDGPPGPPGFFRALPEAEAPHAHAAAPYLFEATTREERFERGLDLMLAGLRAEPGTGGGPPGRAGRPRPAGRSRASRNSLSRPPGTE